MFLLRRPIPAIVTRIPTLRHRSQTSLSSIDFSKALETFRVEREGQMKTTFNVLNHVKWKETTGAKPEKIEDLIASVVAKKSNKNKEVIEPSFELSFFKSESNEAVRSQQTNAKGRKQSTNKGHPEQVVFTHYHPHNQTFEVQLHIPELSLPLLLGKSFWRLQALAADTGCAQLSYHKALTTSEHFLKLIGTSDQVQNAYDTIIHALREIPKVHANQEWKYETCVPVNNEGDPNRIANRIQKVSGSYVVGAQRAVEGDLLVRIWGTQKQVDLACKMVKLYQDPRLLWITLTYSDVAPLYKVRAKFSFPEDKIPWILGRQQSTLQRIQRDTGGVLLKFSDKSSERPYVQLFGTLEQVSAALHQLDDFVIDYDNYLNNVHWKKQIAIRTKHELSLLIGRNFSGIRNLQDATGALVRVSEVGDPSMTIKIWGTDKQVENAIKAIYAVIKFGATSFTTNE